MAAHPRFQRFLWGGLLLLSTLVIIVQGVRLLAAIQAGAATTTDFCLDYQTAQHWLSGARIYTPVTCWSRYSSTPVPVEYYAHPPFSLLVGFAMLGEVPSLSQLIGLAIVIVGFRLTQSG